MREGGLFSLHTSLFRKNLFPNTNSLEAVAQWCFAIKPVLKNFAKFTGKHLSQIIIFNKAAVLAPATFCKKKLWNSCDFDGAFKNTFFIEYFRKLFLVASGRGGRNSFMNQCYLHMYLRNQITTTSTTSSNRSDVRLLLFIFRLYLSFF